MHQNVSRTPTRPAGELPTFPKHLSWILGKRQGGKETGKREKWETQGKGECRGGKRKEGGEGGRKGEKETEGKEAELARSFRP